MYSILRRQSTRIPYAITTTLHQQLARTSTVLQYRPLSSARPRTVVYRDFQPTCEWQIVEPDHILPPGLRVEMDLDGVAKARLEPPKQAHSQQEGGVDVIVASAREVSSMSQPASSVAVVPTEIIPDAEINEVQTTPATSNNTTVTSKTNLTSTSSSSPSSSPSVSVGISTVKRGLRTTARVFNRPDGSPIPRPILYPIYPQLTQEFLAARTMMNAPASSSSSSSTSSSSASSSRISNATISIAPMVDVTDRYFRYLIRLMSKRTVLYTPMLVDNALLRAPLAYPLYVEHDAVEHPLIAQLGGSEADTMVRAAKLLEEQGYQEININCGCPAPSASGHAYGCILMNNPEFPDTVRKIVDAVKIPVTIKCRIGLNKDESFEYFEKFILNLWKIGGVTKFIVHARKAVLNLRTAKNLTVPPLKYDVVHQLKQKYPELHIEINGGFDDWNAVRAQIDEHGLQGVMLGRLAWKNPYAFARVDQDFYGSTNPVVSRIEVVEKYVQYCERIVAENDQLWLKYETTKQELEQQEAMQDEAERKLNHLNLDSATPAAAAASSFSPSSTASTTTSSISPLVFRPSQMLPPPLLLDVRQLLRPVSYLYHDQPGFKKFRQLFEEGLAKRDDWTVRQIMTYAMTAVEPPPERLTSWVVHPKPDAASPATAQENVEALQLAVADGEQQCVPTSNVDSAPRETRVEESESKSMSASV